MQRTIVIRGPDASPIDTDGDGVVDFFDVFPNNSAEAFDTDRDGLGDNADLDDDNDGYTDEEERQATPPTDPIDPRFFPVRLPLVETTTLVVDADTTVSVKEQDGTPDTPYRSISQGLRAVRALRERNSSPQQALTLDVRAGTYSPTTTQEVFPLSLFELPQLTLRGAGRDTTTIDAAFTATAIASYFTDHITIEGFTVLHGSDGIDVENTDGITLRNNRVAEHINDGIPMGPNITGENIVTANIVERNGDEGITLFEDATATITGNMVRDNQTIGIFLQARSQAEIVSNTVINHEEGIWLQNESSAMLSNNTITDNEFDGVVALSHSKAMMKDNTIRDSREFGVLIVENSTVEITGNTIEGSMLDGIQIFDNSTGTIKDNVIRGNQRIGVLIANHATADITSNTIEGNAVDGIQIFDNSTGTIRDNTIHQNQNSGIFIVTASTAEVIANIIENNSFDGIGVQTASTATITANTIHQNQRTGVFIAETSSAELSDNTLSQNGADGILLQNDATAVLMANAVIENGRHGIALLHATAHINGGNISQNREHGVFLVEGATAAIGFGEGLLTIAGSGGAGIFVTDDGSLAQVNTDRIVFDNNGSGLIVGPSTGDSDLDFDGLSNGAEIQWGTDPGNPDTDADGLPDGEEVMILSTNPLLSDSDADTFADGIEVASHSNPLDAGSIPTMILYGAAHIGSGGQSNFYTIDPATGRAILVGPIGFQRVSGMDVDAAGMLYATGVNPEPQAREHVLLTIDPTSGTGVAVGPTGVEQLGFNTVADLSFRQADNMLYAYFATGDGIGTIDPTAAVATLLGPSEISSGNGLAFSLNDTLFHANANTLNTIDQGNAVITVIAELRFSAPADNSPRINAMDFHPETGILFASLNDGASRGTLENYLATIDNATGAVAIIGPTVDGLDALAWFPVP